MFAFTYAAAIIATSFVVVAAVFLKNRRVLDSMLAAHLLSGAVWIGGNVVADVSYTPAVLIAASQVAFFGGILNLFCVVLLVDILIDERFPSWTRVFLYGVPCIALATLGFTHSIEGIAFPVSAPAQIVPGVAYSFALLFYLLALTYGVTRLYLAIRHERKRARRLRLLYPLAGLLLTLAGQMVFDVALPLAGELRFYTLGPICSVFFAAGCAYAATRHQLLDVHIVAQRSLVYSLLLASIVGMYVVLIILTGVLARGTTHLGIIWSAGLATVIGTLTAPAIERSFRRWTDPFFHKDTYDYATAMHDLSEALYAAMTYEALVADIETRLAHILRASFVRISFKASDVGGPGEAFRIPVHLDRKRIGAIIVGEKRSGDPYTLQDRQLLTTFSYQAATALARVGLYAEVKRHARDLERKVEARTEEIRALQEEQRRMMVELSHNLQTPLAILKSKLDRAGRFFTKDGEMQGLEQSVDALSRFIYELLAISSLERRLKEEKRTIVPLTKLMREIVEEVQVIAEANGITVESTIADDVEVRGNERRLQEAVMNLASNAIKYMGTAGERKVRFVLAVEGGMAVVTVADTGIGIPKKDVARIFERFYRGRAKDYEGAEGTGLGLAIVKRIIEEHGGSVAVASTPGVGSIFTLRLPLQARSRTRRRRQ